ncbi:MAG: hypothetical protein B6240_04725 [Desulfobacteraceae bacterium 4572_87]|nr:MAG: hypothetical protein B6240_04725 [Desulfobacteraceae bacterium 4572_87]
MKRNELLTNEDGTILVISLIILALASMIGVAATMTASIELQISGNDMRYAENFYKAEAAAMVGAGVIEVTTDVDLKDKKFRSEGETGEVINLPLKEELPDADHIGDDANWTTGTDKISAEAPDVISEEGYEARFLPVETPAKGASLGLAGTSGTKMHEFVIYGRSVRENPSSNKKLSEAIIEVGYKKRF